MADAIYTQADLDRRLDEARKAGRFKAWGEIQELFGKRQRYHMANMMAHGAKVGAIELVRKDWPKPDRIQAEGATYEVQETSQADALERAAARRVTMEEGHHAQHRRLDSRWVCVEFNTEAEADTFMRAVRDAQQARWLAEEGNAGGKACAKCKGTRRVMWAPYHEVECPDCAAAAASSPVTPTILPASTAEK